jgi:hypothetical protein
VSERMLERARQSDGRRTPGVERLLEGAARLAADSDWL